MKNKVIERLTKKNENGFSLIELVVAIGILLVLTVGGLIGYSTISKNAKQAAVESAVASVTKMIAVQESSSNFNVSSNNGFIVQNVSGINSYAYNEPQDAADEWMRSAGESNKINITAGVDEDLLTVKGIYDNDEGIQALKTAPMSSFSGNYDGNTTTPGDSDGDDTGGNGGNNEDDDNSGSNNGGSDNESENTDFLENPSKIPDEITKTGSCSSEIEYSKIKLYMNEMSRRGSIYTNEFKGYDPEKDGIDITKNALWHDATNVMFNDPDCGFVVAQVRTNNFGDNFKVMIITILVADKDYNPTSGYYRIGTNVSENDSIIYQVNDEFKEYGLNGIEI